MPHWVTAGVSGRPALRHAPAAPDSVRRTATARAVQRSAVAAHASQSEALPEVERRLDLLGGRETLRWLIPAPGVNVPAPGVNVPTAR